MHVGLVCLALTTKLYTPRASIKVLKPCKTARAFATKVLLNDLLAFLKVRRLWGEFGHQNHAYDLTALPVTREITSSAILAGASSYRQKCMVKLARPWVCERSSVA